MADVSSATAPIVNDHALPVKHGQRFDSKGRWLLPGAVFLGFPVIIQRLLAGSAISQRAAPGVPARAPRQVLTVALGAAAYAGLIIVVAGQGAPDERLSASLTTRLALRAMTLLHLPFAVVTGYEGLARS